MILILSPISLIEIYSTKKLSSFGNFLEINSFKKKNVDLREVQKYWEMVIPNAVERYIGELSDEHFSVTDIHYAIQPEYDLDLHLKTVRGIGIPSTEPYVCGVDPLLRRRLRELNILTIPILIKISLDETLRRRKIRVEERNITRSLDGGGLVVDNSQGLMDRNIEYIRRYLKNIA